MRKAAILFLSVVLLSSCGISSTPVNLYYWGGKQNGTSLYEDLSYRSYKEQTPQIVCSLVCAFEDMVKHPGGSRQVPPPGICAEYAYLLLQDNTASIFADNATEKQRQMFDGTDYPNIFKQRAEQMFEMEVQLYPEAEAFIVPLVRKFQNR